MSCFSSVSSSSSLTPAKLVLSFTACLSSSCCCNEKNDRSSHFYLCTSFQLKESELFFSREELLSWRNVWRKKVSSARPSRRLSWFSLHADLGSNVCSTQKSSYKFLNRCVILPHSFIHPFSLLSWIYLFMTCVWPVSSRGLNKASLNTMRILKKIKRKIGMCSLPLPLCFLSVITRPEFSETVFPSLILTVDFFLLCHILNYIKCSLVSCWFSPLHPENVCILQRETKPCLEWPETSLHVMCLWLPWNNSVLFFSSWLLYGNDFNHASHFPVSFLFFSCHHHHDTQSVVKILGLQRIICLPFYFTPFMEKMFEFHPMERLPHESILTVKQLSSLIVQLKRRKKCTLSFQRFQTIGQEHWDLASLLLILHLFGHHQTYQSMSAQTWQTNQVLGQKLCLKGLRLQTPSSVFTSLLMETFIMQSTEKIRDIFLWDWKETTSGLSLISMEIRLALSWLTLVFIWSLITTTTTITSEVNVLQREVNRWQSWVFDQMQQHYCHLHHLMTKMSILLFMKQCLVCLSLLMIEGENLCLKSTPKSIFNPFPSIEWEGAIFGYRMTGKNLTQIYFYYISSDFSLKLTKLFNIILFKKQICCRKKWQSLQPRIYF